MDTSPTSQGGEVISTLGWVLVGVAAWLVVAALVGVLVGRMIRHGDEQAAAEDERSGDHPEEPDPAPRPERAQRHP